VSSISFSTAVCHKDWKKLLCDGLLESRLSNIGYEFDQINVFVNNVDNVQEVMSAAKALPFVDQVFDSSAIKDEVMDFFDIDIYDKIWYSIAPFSAIYKSEYDYIFFMTPDSDVHTKGTLFVQESMEMLTDPITLTTPSWSKKNNAPAWHTDDTVSDQCFIMKSEFARARIYNESNATTNSYPSYAGNSFEKRLCSYIRNHGMKRAIHTKSHYRHQNF